MPSEYAEFRKKLLSSYVADFVYFWTTQGSALKVTSALHSRIIAGGALWTIGCDGDWIWVDCVQDKHPTHCTYYLSGPNYMTYLIFKCIIIFTSPYELYCYIN